jgi:glucose-1-phosphate adenylyltransferase
MKDNVLVMILAGGQGARLMPLTQERAKPAVPFGRYRLIDFVLSNFVNSGFAKIKVLTQYKSNSLNTHLNRGWRLSRILDQYIEPVPAQQNLGLDWYKGSADAIFQNLNIITDEEPEYVCVFGADHVYKMNINQMLENHISTGADLTVAAKPVSLDEARGFGVIGVDENWQMRSWAEKPANPWPMPGRDDHALASMGNYIFKTEALVRELQRDAQTSGSVHDFGRDIITSMYQNTDYKVFCYDFETNTYPGQHERERGYWRDVGTIDSYFEASMDLVGVVPVLDLYNKRWPIRTHVGHHPPAKFVHNVGERVGSATNSLISEGCIVSGGQISASILCPGVRVNSFSRVDDSILFDGVIVGRNSKLRKTIVDKNVIIPPYTTIGYDFALDSARFTISPGGVIVVPKNYQFKSPNE